MELNTFTLGKEKSPFAPTFEFTVGITDISVSILNLKMDLLNTFNYFSLQKVLVVLILKLLLVIKLSSRRSSPLTIAICPFRPSN